MQIRLATTQDIPALQELLQQVLYTHHQGRPDLFKATGSKYTDEQLEALIGHPETTPVWVAQSDDKNVLGHVMCEVRDFTESTSRMPMRTLYVDDLCVHEAARGQHVGKELMAHVENWAQDHGFYNVVLEAWCKNQQAVSFYEHLGFEPYRIGFERIL